MVPPSRPAASATPSGKAIIPNSAHTRKYPTATSAVSRPTGISAASADRLPIAATASAPGMAASSPPSSPATCRGTTPRRRARFDRASASMPSTSSSRRASPFRPSSTSMRTTRSLLSRWRRRATPTRRRKLAAKLGRKPCLGTSRPPVAPTIPAVRLNACRTRRGGATSTPVSLRPLGARSSHWYMPQRIVQSARIGGVGVVDDAILQHEGAHARPFARVGRHVGPGHGGALRGAHRVSSRDEIAGLSLAIIRQRRLAPVIVFDAAVALLLLAEPDVEVGLKSLANDDAQGKVQPMRCL